MNARLSALLLLAGLTLGAALIWPELAWAHDCSGPQDCEQTAGYNAVISVVGAISAILAGVLGSSIAAGTTVPSVIAGTTPPPGRDETRGPLVEGTEEPGRHGPFNELPPGSDGWVVTDTDGKEHIFETEDEANDYYDHLSRELERENEAERVRQLENDYRNAAEQVGFLDSVIQGLKNAGKDASEQIRDRDRYIRERDRLRGQVGQAGGNTDYRVTERSPFKFGENDDLIRRRDELADERERLDRIHRMDDTLDRLEDKGMVGENPALTDKIRDRLRRMSDEMVREGGKQPSWDDIQKMRDMIRRDMDATDARHAAEDTDWVREGAQATSREVLTGVDSEGNTSYKSMVLRGLLAASTGGQSEIGMEVGDKMYGIHDDVMAGKSGLDAYGNAIKRVLVDETIGRAMEGGLKVGGKGVNEVYERTLKGTDLDKGLRRAAGGAGDFLNRDVKDFVRGSGDEVAEGLGPRVPRSGAEPNVRTDVEPDVSRGGRDFDQRQADFEAGRARGAEKVSELESALEHRRNNPGPDADARVRAAVDDVQTDKHAMHELNNRGGDKVPHETKAEFNRELQESYETAHQSSRDRIGQEYGADPDDVKVVKPTNDPNAPDLPPDPRGTARRPDGSVDTHGDDFAQRPPDGPVEVADHKSSYDQDVTYRVRQDSVVDPRTGHAEPGFADVPKADSQRIYNEEFYKARHDGDLPYRTDADGNVIRNAETGRPEVDTDAVNRYADDMDQACTDRLDAEAYGNGDRDLKTATESNHVGEPFNDVEQVGKTMEHKNYEWQKRADETRAHANQLEADARIEADAGNPERAAELRGEAAELHQKAEAQIEEGYRQTTKQFDNQIRSRVDALNAQHGRTVAEIPPRLEEAVNIMQDPGLSPAQVERELARLGTSPDRVVQQMSSNLEALQKFNPPPAGAPNTGFDWGGAAENAVHGAARSGPS